MKGFLLFAAFSLIICNAKGQASGSDSVKVNRSRITLTAGAPIIAGLHVEYLTPINKNRFSVTADFGRVPSIVQGAKGFIRYAGVGVNRYFNTTGTKYYTGLEYGNQFVQLNELDGDPVDINVQFQWISPKLGMTLGNQLFFRMELGYSIILFNIDRANEFLDETFGVRVIPTQDFIYLPNLHLGLGVKF